MRIVMYSVVFLVAGCLGSSAIAQEKPAGQPDAKPGQPGGGGAGGGGGAPRGRGGGGMLPPLAPEKAKAAWEAQAKHVASGLGLDAPKTAALSKAYAEARTSHTEAGEKLRTEAMKTVQDGARPDVAAMQKKLDELNASEREKLQKAIAATVTAEQATKAMATLGTFSRQWDVMTDAMIGFKLETAKEAGAYKAMDDFVIASEKLRTSDDREARRTGMTEARKKLGEAMKAVLSEEQFKKFETLLPGGGRGGRPGADAEGGAPRKSRNGG